MTKRVLTRSEIELMATVLRKSVEKEAGGENQWFVDCVNNVATDLLKYSRLNKEQLSHICTQDERIYALMNFEERIAFDGTLQRLTDHVFDHLDEFKSSEKTR